MSCAVQAHKNICTRRHLKAHTHTHNMLTKIYAHADT